MSPPRLGPVFEGEGNRGTFLILPAIFGNYYLELITKSTRKINHNMKKQILYAFTFAHGLQIVKYFSFPIYSFSKIIPRHIFSGEIHTVCPSHSLTDLGFKLKNIDSVFIFSQNSFILRHIFSNIVDNVRPFTFSH